LPQSEGDYQALLVFVGGSKPSASAIETLPPPMPSKGLVPGSEKYILGLEAAKRIMPSFRTDLIGFEYGAEVQLGQYKTDKGTSTLVSISYPTPQIARVRFGALKNFLGLNQDHGEASVYGTRRGSYLFLVLNAVNEGTATALINLFQVTEGVTWDQRYVTEGSFTRQLVQMILAIFLLTAILIGACIVAGVLFFLSRRIAAKYFPESSWGRTDEDQLIRLNLKT
jgi:multisubunit Na+/H+ antiporter MnhC subunit